MKAFLSRFKYLVIGILLATAVPVSAQLIYGNTFPFWNVNGPLTVTGTTTLSGTNNFAGITNGSAASAGYIGEILSGATASSAAVTITTTQTKGLACTSLTPGDWDVRGTGILSAATAVMQSIAVGVAVTALSGTGPSVEGNYNMYVMSSPTITGNSAVAVTTPSVPINISSTAIYCITATPAFTSGTAAVYGTLNARRMR